MTMADRVAAIADEDGGRRNFLSAAEKFGRATAYYITAEFWPHGLVLAVNRDPDPRFSVVKVERV
jgi:hypothetical protein